MGFEEFLELESRTLDPKRDEDVLLGPGVDQTGISELGSLKRLTITEVRLYTILYIIRFLTVYVGIANLLASPALTAADSEL